MPDVGQVPGQAPGKKEDGIDADVVAGPRIAHRQPFGGDRDPAQAVCIEGQAQPFLGAARLDLDEGKRPAAAGDQVDLAARHARPLRQDSPPVQAQPPGRQPFGPPAALFGDDTPVQRLSSSARA